MTDTVFESRINGLDLSAPEDMVGAVRQDPAKAIVRFKVKTRWTGQTRSETIVEL